jgi:mono/diheme cytochrome c family protein
MMETPTAAKWKWFILGAMSSPLVLCGIAFVFVKARADGFSTRTPPMKLEVIAAEGARRLALPKGASARVNPVGNSPQVLEEAAAHWADHCASCHGNDGKGKTPLGQQMYPRAPDMALQSTQRMSDGELFFIIENGVRLSGMPGWGGAAHGEEDSWKLVHFIRHLPSLTSSEIEAMEKLNPKTPDEIEEERQEQEFLSGKPISETRTKGHHH